jgi:hypothetical protein
LVGPWIVIRYEQVSTNNSLSRGYYVYYDGPGECEDEFQYIVDYLFRFQLVDGTAPVEIRLANACATASAHFEKAKAQYLKLYWPLLDESKKESENRIKKLSYAGISTQITRFSEIELGFEHG